MKKFEKIIFGAMCCLFLFKLFYPGSMKGFGSGQSPYHFSDSRLSALSREELTDYFSKMSGTEQLNTINSLSDKDLAEMKKYIRDAAVSGIQKQSTRICGMNLRTLTMALEMYAMDKKVPYIDKECPLNSSDPFAQLLVSSSYIRSLPGCKSGGEYSMMIANSKDSSGKVNEVRCSLHGSLDKPLELDADKDPYAKSSIQSMDKMLEVLTVQEFISFSNYANETNTPKACMANMRVLTGAIEMLTLDTGFEVKNGEVSFSDPLGKTLIEKKYLNSEVACPKGGNYEISVGATQEYEVTCRNHGSVTSPKNTSVTEDPALKKLRMEATEKLQKIRN